MAYVVKKDHGIMGQDIVYYTCKEQTNAPQHKERNKTMENTILRIIETAIKERAFETVRQLADFMLNDYRFSEEAQDFADQLLNELEENN